MGMVGWQRRGWLRVFIQRLITQKPVPMASMTRANVKRLKLTCVVVDKIIELDSLISDMFDSKAFVIL